LAFLLQLSLLLVASFVQKGQEYSAENYQDSFTQLNYQTHINAVSREVRWQSALRVPVYKSVVQ